MGLAPVLDLPLSPLHYILLSVITCSPAVISSFLSFRASNITCIPPYLCFPLSNCVLCLDYETVRPNIVNIECDP